MPSDEFPTFITTCSEDEDGNLIFEIPDELLDALAWKEGTVLDISALPGRIMLREVVKSEPEPNSEPEPVVLPVEGKPKAKGRTPTTRSRKKS